MNIVHEINIFYTYLTNKKMEYAKSYGELIYIMITY